MLGMAMFGKCEVQKFIFQLCWRDYFRFYCVLAKGLMCSASLSRLGIGWHRYSCT